MLLRSLLAWPRLLPWSGLIASVPIVFVLLALSVAAQDSASVTAADPNIPVEDLQLLVKPLTADELKVEAEAWLALLKSKVAEISRAEMAVNQRNREIDEAEQVTESAAQAEELLSEVAAISQEVADGDMGPDSEARMAESAAEAKAAVQQVAEDVGVAEETVDEVEVLELPDQPEASVADRRTDQQAMDEAEQAVARAVAGATAVEQAASTADSSAENRAADTRAAVVATQGALDEVGAAAAQVSEPRPGDASDPEAAVQQLADRAEAAVEAGTEAKQDVLDKLTQMREERAALADRLDTVLDEFSRKTGVTLDGKDVEEVQVYRRYVAAVSGIEVDVEDAQASTTAILGWLRSDEGGLRWARNLASAGGIVFAFWVLSVIVSRLLAGVLAVSRSSVLLSNFLSTATRRIIQVIGVVISLAALEINIGPLLALIGAAGFVLGFALQQTLSSYASGILILLYKPFDLNDEVEVAGIEGQVVDMSLVNTTVRTSDNQNHAIPNNLVWGSTIINTSSSNERRVDMVFAIRHEEDQEHAQAILEEIVAAHPLVLDSPEPMIRVDEVSDGLVKFIVRPWVLSGDRSTVYWELMRQIKERFDAEGFQMSAGRT